MPQYGYRCFRLRWCRFLLYRREIFTRFIDRERGLKGDDIRIIALRYIKTCTKVALPSTKRNKEANFTSYDVKMSLRGKVGQLKSVTIDVIVRTSMQ